MAKQRQTVAIKRRGNCRPMNTFRITDALLFALVISLVLPPCFAAPPAVPSFEPKISSFVLFAIAVLVLAHYAKAFLPSKEHSIAQKAVTAGAALVAFGALCLSSVLMGVLLYKKVNALPLPPMPRGGVFLCVITFLLSAFYEETIYRLYLPAVLLAIFEKVPPLDTHRYWRRTRGPSLDTPPSSSIRPNGLFTGHGSTRGPSLKASGVRITAAKVMAEATAVAVFAFAHKYSGAASIINALIAAAVLRVCFIRGKSFAACVLVHTVYNVLQYVMASRLLIPNP